MYGSFVELRSEAEAELFCSAACAEQSGAALEGAVRRGVWGALWKDKVRYCAAVRRWKARQSEIRALHSGAPLLR